jgi:hypothetical protein
MLLELAQLAMPIQRKQWFVNAGDLASQTRQNASHGFEMCLKAYTDPPEHGITNENAIVW